MRVLVGCEFSGAVRNAFACLGHEALSCDLEEAEDGGTHYQGDVLELLQSQPFDLAVFHPPCTYLTNAGVRWLYTEPGRWDKMLEGADFFNACRDAPIERIAVENPIPHGMAAELIGQYDQIIQPWMFGHWETKRTCLWLKNLPKLVPTYKTVDEAREALEETGKPVARVHLASPGPNRWKERSRTLPGIAAAMAAQWSSI